MTSTLKVLVSARKLLSDPAHWTRGDLAHDAAGDSIDPRSEDAVCWCVMGAVQKFSLGAGYQGDALSLVYSVVGGISEFYDELNAVPEFNDSPATTHTDILRVLDAAIERAQS